MIGWSAFKMAIKSYILFVFRSTPYGSLKAREGIDALLATSVFDLPIKVLFTGDGVFQLQENQSPTATRSIEKSLGALPIYDIDDVYLHQEALAARQMDTNCRSIKTQLLNNQAVAALMHNATHILSF